MTESPRRHGHGTPDRPAGRKLAPGGALHAASGLGGLVSDTVDAARARTASWRDARRFVAFARNGMIGLDDRGRVTLWNPAAQRIFGHDERDAVGRELATLIFPTPGPADELALSAPEHGERMTEVVAVRADGVTVPVSLRVARLPGRGRTRVGVLVRDLTEQRARERRQAVLARTVELLESSMDYERTLGEVAALAVPEFADWCGVDLPGPKGLPVPVAMAHAQPELVELARELRRRYPVSESDALAHVMRGGEPFLRPEVSDAEVVAYARDDEHLRLLRAVGFRSLMIVPLRAGRRTIGAMTFVASESGDRFDDHDLALAQELAERAGAAVEAARLAAERAEVTQTLLATLRPPALPALPGWETATLYQPAERSSEVGGDFYDLFAVRDGWMLVIGDVIGKGPAAAALTSLARWSIRSAATLTASPSRALENLNADLDREGQPGLLSATCVLLRGRADGGGATATVAAAGHPLPVLVREGEATPVGRHSPLLGILPDAVFAETTIDVHEGDALVLYTDGVLDTAGHAGRFGERRLVRALCEASGGPAASVLEHVAARLVEFQAGLPSDDIALLAVRRTSAAAGQGHAASVSLPRRDRPH